MKDFLAEKRPYIRVLPTRRPNDQGKYRDYVDRWHNDRLNQRAFNRSWLGEQANERHLPTRAANDHPFEG